MTIRDYKEHLEKRSEKIPIAGCWLWTGAKKKDGYGNIRYKDQVWIAHRLSYQIFRGDIPKDGLVLHKCDVPSCINPHHLFLGSAEDNMQDMVKKGRKRGGRTSRHN